MLEKAENVHLEMFEKHDITFLKISSAIESCVKELTSLQKEYDKAHSPSLLVPLSVEESKTEDNNKDNKNMLEVLEST